MPFIPHTEDDLNRMLDAIGVESLERLFEEIPPELDVGRMDLPAALHEREVTRLMNERARTDSPLLCFAGGGAYEHHVPAVVWDLASRGEFYTAYTPYQAEASQGTLQVLYEFQTMMASLCGLDVSNASLYDGASALAEAVLMAVRCQSRAPRRVLVPAGLNPRYLDTVRALVTPQEIDLVPLPLDVTTGRVVWDEGIAAGGYAALVVGQPNCFGVLEDVDALTDRAHGEGALVIALVNPVALGLLKPPGAWGGSGADIACGEGQPLGAPLSSGGPGFGFLCSDQKHLRQMPGRIVGRTVDGAGQTGFVLTLQAREQHIRRSRATSNICTNQGLMTVAAAIHLSVLGPEGLRETARLCHENTLALLDLVRGIPGVEPVFDAPFFHEVAIRVPRPVGMVLQGLAGRGILGGVDLTGTHPVVEGALLFCVTETRNREDLTRYAEALKEVLS